MAVVSTRVYELLLPGLRTAMGMGVGKGITQTMQPGQWVDVDAPVAATVDPYIGPSDDFIDWLLEEKKE